MVEFKIEEFECISPQYAEMLRAKLNIVLVDDFYKYSKEKILQEIDVDTRTAQQWFDVLELFKIPKMTPRYAELLYYANVNSIEELAHREASRIYYKFQRLDKETFLILLHYPTFSEIDSWIYYAKLMINRTKNGCAIPMVQIPNFTVDRASDLAKFGIYTVDDFLFRKEIIKGLRRNILDMSRSDYEELLRFVNLLRIDGVDVYFAKVLWEGGYTNYDILKESPESEILFAVKNIQKYHQDPPELMTKE